MSVLNELSISRHFDSLSRLRFKTCNKTGAYFLIIITYFRVQIEDNNNELTNRSVYK